jgi:hypothetical protein
MGYCLVTLTYFDGNLERVILLSAHNIKIIYDVCQEMLSIEHLIYSCTYVKPLLQTVSQVCGIVIDYSVILGINNMQSSNIDFIITLICFVIYKEWLLLSQEYKCRRNCIKLDFYKGELDLII